MSMSDTIADMLTRIRNGQSRKILNIHCPHSNFKEAVLKVLKEEGYIAGYSVETGGKHKLLDIDLKYTKQGRPVINEIKRVSKPGKRMNTAISKLQPHYNGLGIYILSTSKGVLSDRQAFELNVGGEVICKIF